MPGLTWRREATGRTAKSEQVAVVSDRGHRIEAERVVVDVTGATELRYRLTWPDGSWARLAKRKQAEMLAAVESLKDIELKFYAPAKTHHF